LDHVFYLIAITDFPEKTLVFSGKSWSFGYLQDILYYRVNILPKLHFCLRLSPEKRSFIMRRITTIAAILSTYAGAALWAVSAVPVEHLSTFRAAVLPLHFLEPRFGAELLHILQFFDNRFMVGDTIHHMYIFEILQSRTRELCTLKTPCYLMFFSTIPKSVRTLFT
jgi:hypothetical protein